MMSIALSMIRLLLLLLLLMVVVVVVRGDERCPEADVGYSGSLTTSPEPDRTDNACKQSLMNIITGHKELSATYICPTESKTKQIIQTQSLQHQKLRQINLIKQKVINRRRIDHEIR